MPNLLPNFMQEYQWGGGGGGGKGGEGVLQLVLSIALLNGDPGYNVHKH